MKFSDRNNAVHFLLDNDPVRFIMSKRSTEFDETLNYMEKGFLKKKAQFRQRIQYLSKPFYEAYLKGKGKLMKVLLEEPVKQSGTFIVTLPDQSTNTVFYDMETKLDGQEKVKNGRIIIFNKSKQIREPILFFYCQLKDNDTITFLELDAIIDGFDTQTIISDILGMILFMKYCEVETKIISAGKRAIHVNEEYVNKTKLPIEVLDSTWFTTLVRSEGFTVGGETGFFRLQSVGPGRSEKKLIWVAPFEKKGYTRKAKVLTRGKGQGAIDTN